MEPGGEPSWAECFANSVNMSALARLHDLSVGIDYDEEDDERGSYKQRWSSEGKMLGVKGWRTKGHGLDDLQSTIKLNLQACCDPWRDCGKETKIVTVGRDYAHIFLCKCFGFGECLMKNPSHVSIH